MEALRVGDAVLTVSREQRRIAWIGFREVDLRRHPRPDEVMPVRVGAHAVASGVPHREVVLSPDHALYIDGVLIPVRYLCNGATIKREFRGSVSYFHIELDSHDILLAEGLPVESYLDTGNRSAFANAPGVVMAHADFARAVWAARACAPLVLDGSRLHAARQRLLRRAGSLGHAQTDDPALRLVADGVTVWPDRTGDIYRFRLPRPATVLRLLSRSAIPSEMTAVSDDCRRLGVAVAHLNVDGERVALDDARQSAGWHAPERDWRWTDGDASLRCPGGGSLDGGPLFPAPAPAVPVAAAAPGVRIDNGIGGAGSLLLVAGLADNTGPSLDGSTTSDDTIAGRLIDTAAIVSLTMSVDGGGTVDEIGILGAGGHFTLTPQMLG